MSKARTAITALALSAAGLVGLIQHEGYKSAAYIPVPGDVPTIGHGTTRYEDGSAVKLGDRVTPERAQVLLRNDASKFERAVKRCAPVPMYPYEYDAFVSLAYNIGEDAFCRSTLAKKLNALDYAGACREIEKWVYFKGKTLPGLVKRRADERARCEGRV